MKYIKYLMILTLFTCFTNFSYANGDISNLIFQGSSIDDAIIVNSSVSIVSEPPKNTVSKTKSEREIDLFIEKAISDATKKEEERLREEKIKEEERKKEEKRQEEEKRRAEDERRRAEREKEEREKRLEFERSVNSNVEITPTSSINSYTSSTSVSSIEPVNTALISNEVSSNDVTVFAKTLIGVPYVWGGTTTKGFDCSGFVKYIYERFGLSINRTTYDQIKQGVSVSLDSIQENDLVFFDTRASSQLLKAKNSTSSNTLDDIIINEKDTANSKKLNPTEPTHVGIYIGNGMIIHASSSKKQVIIDNLYNGYFENRIVDVRRYK